jgi:heat shock 70kDa protein 1/2/6/8
MASAKFKKPIGRNKIPDEPKADTKPGILTQKVSKIVVGIDFGTSYVSIGTLRTEDRLVASDVKLAINEYGDRRIPSCVSFMDEDIVIGTVAQQNAWKNPDRTIRNFKQLVGKRWTDDAVQQTIKISEVPLVEKDGRPAYRFFHKNECREMFAEEIVTLFFEKLKDTIKHQLGFLLEEVVMSLPVHYEPNSLNAFENALRKADLNVLGFIKDPIACILAIEMEQASTRDTGQDENVLVCDFGGSGADITVITVRSGMYSILHSTHDESLAGRHFDEKLCEFFVQECLRLWNVDVTNEKRCMDKLRSASETSKRQLSTQMSAAYSIECLYDGMDFQGSISCTRYEYLCDSLFQRLRKSIETVLGHINLSADSINKVIRFFDTRYNQLYKF